MDSRTDQFERHGHADLKPVYAIELLRPVDFACCYAPRITTYLTEPLAFREERLAASQSFLGSLLFTQIENESHTFIPAPSKSVPPSRTGTRLPSFRRYSFSNG